MNQNTETSFLNIADLTRDEKREIWLKRSGHTQAQLADVVGVVPNVLSRYLRAASMQVDHQKALVAFGVPEELLPPPEAKRPGRPPRTPRVQAESATA